jgi:hypothetical protein
MNALLHAASKKIVFWRIPMECAGGCPRCLAVASGRGHGSWCGASTPVRWAWRLDRPPPPGHVTANAKGMAAVENSDDARVEEAVMLARKVAPDFEAVFLLHCHDPAMQTLVMPEQPDQSLQTRLNAAVAAELVANGVEVAVQVVDRAAYLAWLGGRESSRAWRIGFRDPARLLRGAVALDLLGVPPSVVRPRPKPPEARQRKGTPADRLIRAWCDDHPECDRLLGQLLDEERQGVLDVAIRKVTKDYGAEAAEDFAMTLLEKAEGAESDGGAWATLFAVAAFVDPELGKLPDPVPIAEGMKASGHFAEGCDISILPAWFDSDAITSITACALRRTLRDMAGGRMPSGLTPLERPPAHGTVALLGVSVDHYPTAWEDAVDIEESKGKPSESGADEVMRRYDVVFENWSDGLIALNADLIDILLPTVPSQLANCLDAAADEMRGDESTPGAPSAEELQDFIDIAAEEAGEEGLVCVPRIVDGRVQL